MAPQQYTHPDEVLHAAPILNTKDGGLFEKQNVWLNDLGEVRWEFILHNGKVWNFAQRVMHLSREGQLRWFKTYIETTLREEGR